MNFLELTRARYSVRNYTDRLVEPEKLDYIFECVRMAPSAVNYQPWRFAVVTDPERLAALKTAYPREWIQTAPCIIVACANHEESWHRKSDGKDHADIDLGIAVEHLCLAAAEQGLGTCWVCNFDTDLCRKHFNLPDTIEPAVILTIGYPESPDLFEQTPKKRKTLEEIIKEETF